MEQIQGILTKIRFQKPDTKWGIFNVQYQDDSGKHSCSFTGVMPNPVIGQSYIFEGEMKDDPKWGLQFVFKSHLIMENETADGAFALLSSNRFKGIGPKKAKAIVARFGKNTLQIIRDTPERLVEVNGINIKTAKMIHDSMPNLGVWEQLRMMLRHATDNAVNKIYEVYGDKSLAVLKRDPYVLIKEVDGFGFLRADAIAASVGITGDHPMRVQAAIYHCLDSAAEKDGHCFSYANNLQQNVEALIPGVSVETMATALQALTAPSNKCMRVHIDPDGAIYLYRLWWAETTCSDAIHKLLHTKVRYTYTKAMVDNAADAIAAETGIVLDDSQKDAIFGALNNQICVITGGPGTGKSTIINTILQAIKQQECHPWETPSVALMAPTGRAARRMREITGYYADTIHSMVQLHDRKEPLNVDYVIVDESSMIDIELAARLLNALRPSTHVIFVGDNDQLPPVGPGVFFRDLLKSYKVPKVRLQFSFRQDGSLARNAHSINNGEGPHAYVTDKDFTFVAAKKEDGPQKAMQEYLRYVSEFGLDDTVLLSSTRQRGAGCTNELNKALQQALFPHRTGATLKTYDFEIGVGDRVMLTKNHKIENHANGDVGTVQEIDENGIYILFDGDSDTTYTLNDIAKSYLVLAYAITVHKSQGSEYRGVVFLFTTEHSFMGERGIVYTAVTRAKKKCTMVCDPRAVALAVSKVKPITRNSKLVDRINETVTAK